MRGVGAGRGSAFEAGGHVGARQAEARGGEAGRCSLLALHLLL